MKNKFKPPEPVENQDYYIDELYEYTVCIEVSVRGLEESYSESDTCADAVHRFRNGMIDGDARVVNSEYIKNVALDWDTDEPFDRDAWTKAKLLELGLNSDGEPLRPGEVARPISETTLDYYDKSYWLRQWRMYNENQIARRWFI